MPHSILSWDCDFRLRLVTPAAIYQTSPTIAPLICPPCSRHDVCSSGRYGKVMWCLHLFPFSSPRRSSGCVSGLVIASFTTNCIVSRTAHRSVRAPSSFRPESYLPTNLQPPALNTFQPRTAVRPLDCPDALTICPCPDSQSCALNQERGSRPFGHRRGQQPSCPTLSASSSRCTTARSTMT